jgi:aspartyl protease family protein
MKYFLIFIFLPVFLKSQDLNVSETLSYINKQLNDPNNKVKKSKVNTFIKEYEVSLSNVDRVFMDDYTYQVLIENGVLKVIKKFSKIYATNKFNYAISKYESATYMPIIEEQAIDVYEIENIDESHRFEKLYCSSSPAFLYIPIITKHEKAVLKVAREFSNSGTEINKKTEKLGSIKIEFSNDNLICDRLINAFIHLISLIKNDKSFYSNQNLVKRDPFDMPKNSLVQGNGSIESDNSNSIPMTKKGGVFEIPVLINGSLKLNFIFDAGAADVSIPPDVALTLIRTGTLKSEDFLGTETYRFADGSTARSKVFVIKELQLGNKKVTNIRASISKSINAPLLLGQSVLNKFGKITIDYKRQLIIFQD